MDIINKINDLLSELEKNILSEDKVCTVGKELQFADEPSASLMPDYPEVILAKDKSGKKMVMVYKDRNKFFAEGDYTKKSFTKMNDLVDFLNANGYKYFEGYNKV